MNRATPPWSQAGWRMILLALFSSLLGFSTTVLGSDCGSDTTNAINIATTSSTPCTLDPSGDADVFQLTLPGDGTLSVTTSGSTDTFGTFLDEFGATIATSDDEGLDTNFLLEGTIDAGVYFIVVTGFDNTAVGPYSLDVIFTPTDTCGTPETGVILDADTITCGIEFEGDTDYLQVVLDDAGTLTLTSAGAIDTVGQLLDAAGAQLAIDDDGGTDENFLIVAELEAGTYWLVVNGFSNTIGTYDIDVSFERTDSCGTETAGITITDETTDCTIEFDGDQDYLQLVIDEPGAVTLTSASSIDTVARLVDVDGNVLIVDDDSGVDANFLIETSLDAGTYWLFVTGFGSTTGSYSVVTTFIPDSAATDSCGSGLQDAVAPALDTPLDCVIETDGDADFFYLPVGVPGTLTVFSEGDLDTVATLTNHAGTGLVTDDDSGTNRNFQLTLELTPGDYFLRVTGFGASTGGYRVTLQFEADTTADSCGLSFSTALDINVNGVTNCELEHDADQDYFRFALPVAGELTVSSSGNLDTVGWLLDDNGNVLLTSDDEGQDANFLLTQSLSEGVYFITVGSGQAGAYDLNVVFQPAATGADTCGRLSSPVPMTPGSALTCAIEVSGDVDFFTLTLVAPGTLTLFSRGDIDTVGILLDSEGNLIASNDYFGSSANFHIEQLLDTGTYFLAVQGFAITVGEYEVHATISAEDSCATDASGAVIVTPNSTTPCAIDFSGDNDYFRLSLTTPGTLTVYSTGTTDTFASVLNVDGNVVADDDDGGDNTNFLLTGDVLPGDFLLRVRGFSGSVEGDYSLVV